MFLLHISGISFGKCDTRPEVPKFYFEKVCRYGTQQKSPFCKAPRGTGMLPFSYSNRSTKAGLSKDNGGLIRTKQRFGGKTKRRAGWESLSCRTAELILICDTEMGKTDKHPQLMRTQNPPSHIPCSSELDSKRKMGVKRQNTITELEGTTVWDGESKHVPRNGSNKFSTGRQIVYLYLWHHSQDKKTNKTRAGRQCKVSDSCGEWAEPNQAERGNLPAVEWEEWQ